ncbi:unnamed protein product [Polarella glacialis]|uniref:Helicase C-terminal domain-containing protein n=2 Tax=Polarella glacialis TaxID=89957 RepID=A0A813ES08_POLGL|nr:unnamed protein product [Polarella glacialis]
MARLACRDAPTLQSIAKHAAALNQQADFRGSGGLGRLEISKLAWAFASLEVHDSNFMEGLARQAAILQRELTQQDLSNLAWACAKLLASNSVLLKVVSEESVNKIKGFKPQELANLIWAVSTLQLQGQASENLFRAVASEATMKLRSFKAQELANLAWAFAKRSHGFQPQPQGQTGLGVGASEMLLALAEQASKAAHEFKAQELSSLVWALAAARVNHQAVLKAVGQQAAAKVRDFTSQGLSNIVQAYAKLDASHVGEQAGVFRAVAQHATPRLSQFKPEELSMLSWSFGKLAVVFEPELFRGIAAQATKISAKLTPQGISNLLYGFAKADSGASAAGGRSHGACRVRRLVRQRSADGLVGRAAVCGAAARADPERLDEAVRGFVQPPVNVYMRLLRNLLNIYQKHQVTRAGMLLWAQMRNPRIRISKTVVSQMRSLGDASDGLERLERALALELGEGPNAMSSHCSHSVMHLPKIENSLYNLIMNEMARDRFGHKILVFFATARLTSFMAQFFRQQLRIGVLEMHRRRDADDRVATQKRFQEGRSGIMFTSDVSARGMDYPNVTLVLQFGAPATREMRPLC